MAYSLATGFTKLTTNIPSNDLYNDVDNIFLVTKRSISIGNYIAVIGDNNAEVVTFEMDRYEQGIDLIDKIFEIKYMREDRTTGTSTGAKGLINFAYSDTKIRFSWLIDFNVTFLSGNVSFIIKVYSDNYQLKTKPATINIINSLITENNPDSKQLNLGDVIYYGNDTPNSSAKIWISDVVKYKDANGLWQYFGSGASSTYTSPSAIPQTLGGITAGKSYTNVPIQVVLNDLLFPYTAPQVIFATSLSGGLREYGDNISNLILTATTTKKSNPISSVSFYKDSTLLNTVSTPNPSGGNEVFTYTTPITSSCTLTSKVSDGTQIITSNGITYTFVYPMYIGSVTSATPSESAIKSMTKRIVAKANQSFSYTINNASFCFAYPTSYGDLTSIKDTNNFEILNSFTKQTLSMTMLNGSSVSYNIYVSSLTTQTAFNVTYTF